MHSSKDPLKVTGKGANLQSSFNLGSLIDKNELFDKTLQE